MLLATLLLLLGSGWARAESSKILSEVIYPPASRTLSFSHQKHPQVKCLDCHPTISGSVSPQDRNLPKEAACQPCHASQVRKKETIRQSKSPACRTCHAGYQGRLSPARSAFPTARLRFSHAAHLKRSKGCKPCHQPKMREDNPRPSMDTCRRCHLSKKAPLRCAVCHLAGKDGKLLTNFPQVKLRPTGALRGAAHGPLFKKRHGAVARADRKYCGNCHGKSDCLRCHAGTLRPMSIHQGDYLRRHSLDARRDSPRCSGCHRTQSFCLSCHQRLGVGTETKGNGFAPTTAMHFHPPSFNTPTVGPGHHAHAARRNIRSCSSCHRESTCVRCHGSARQNRGGISPHPAGFRTSAKCRALSARNQRVCHKCHNPGDRRVSCW